MVFAIQWTGLLPILRLNGSDTFLGKIKHKMNWKMGKRLGKALGLFFKKLMALRFELW